MWVNEQLAQDRYNKCKVCTDFNKNLLVCNHCFCFMKVKVKIESSICPLGKW